MSKRCVICLAVALLLPCVAVMALSGAVYTTDRQCDGVNVNIFDTQEDVYLNGGPANENARGLDDGVYCVKVTEPNGTVLGTSAEGAVVVVDGRFVQCYQLMAICFTASSGFTVPGYDPTSNNGGEYKVIVSPDCTFANGNTKEDNFKVRTQPDPALATIEADKFYDLNANGVWDTGEVEIPNWEICFQELPAGTPNCEHVTPMSVVVEPGSYLITEGTPVQGNWVHTTPVSVTLTVADGETQTATFGNVCLGEGGGRTLGFWSNKNGQRLITSGDLAMLGALNLRNEDGSDFDPASNSEFRTWILSARATNMAYMLSAQLAAMELNVAHGMVSPGALVYAPCLVGTNAPGANALGFISVGDLMAAANDTLGAQGTTPAGDPLRSYQECLKTSLDNANNNLNFVQGAPCPFSF